jgi:Holliday junction resolvasome RuvABC DNA-binding subunit
MTESRDATRLAIELRLRLSELTHPVDESTANELRDMVGHYAAALRTLGMKPEAAVAAVERVLHEAGLEARPGEQPTDAITPEDQLRIDVVGWCIEGFNDLEAAG